MKRFTQWMLLLGIGLSTGVVFQNCGTYQPEESDEFASLGEDCLEPVDCIQGEEPEAITLGIGNEDPERLLRTDKAFDVGGYCDPSGYPSNKIIYGLRNPAGTLVLGPITVIDGCDQFGRFHIRVDLPANFNYDLAHTLLVSLVAIDSRGEGVENPLGLNRRELGVIAQPAQQ